MTILRTITNLADREPFRPILALAASRLAGANIRFEYDGRFWLFRTQGHALPHARRFSFYRDDIERLPRMMTHYLDETRDCWFYNYTAEPGDVIVDVGAEIGTDTITFSQAVGPSGKVYAIEAQPETYLKLLSTCKANALNNVVAVNIAVADKPSIVHISSGAGVESNFLCDEGEAVQADSLDNILRNEPEISFLKKNIEGAERLAIEGMDETIGKTRHLVIACHDFVGKSTGDDWFNTQSIVVKYLSKHGFEIRTRANDSREYVRYHIHAQR